MGREIKFRAWDKRSEYFIDDMFLRLDGILYDYADDRFDTPNEEIEASNPADFILEQFTGLLDKNGKEIYEGDIIVSTTKDFRQRINHNNSPVKGVIKYEAPSFYIDVNGIMGIALDNGFDEHEIIGNIHEGGI